MVAFLTETVMWWHWIVLGILLIIAEMGTGTFIVLGFGIAAVLVGFIDLFSSPNFVVQLILWIILSVATITLLFKYFKQQTGTSTTGQSDHGFDTLGTVTETIEANQRGKVRFDAPVLGNTLWHATAKEKIDAGQKVRIEAVNGQLISVAPAQMEKTKQEG